MKTIFVAAALAVFSFKANAKNPTSPRSVNFKIVQTFEQEFGNVQSVQWDVTANNLVKASFNLEGENVCAFFDEQGYYVASTVCLTEEQLPFKLRNALQNKYKSAQIAEIIELRNGENDGYFILIKEGNTTKLLKGYGDGFLREESYKGLQ